MACVPWQILTLFVVGINISPSSGSPDAICNIGASKCCERDRMVGACLKGFADEFTDIFSENERKLFSFWNFDKFPTTNDAMNLSKTVTITNPPGNHLKNGVKRKGLTMDGTAGVNLANYSATCLFQNTSMGLTLSMWLKYGNKSSDDQTFFTLGDDDTSDCGARLKVVQPNTTLEEVGVLTNIQGRRLLIRFICPWNIWSHIVVAWDSVASSVAVYRNARLIENAYYDICFGCNDTNKYNAYIGESNNAKAPNASLDEIALWCRGLNSTEVQNAYEYYKGPSGYYLIMAVTFTTIDAGPALSSKIQQLVPSITSADINTINCKYQKECDVIINVTVSDGDAVVPLLTSGALGNNVTLRSYQQTVVPNSNIKFYGNNISESGILLNWNMYDDQPFSIFQYYEIRYHPKSSPASLVNFTEDRYRTTWTLVKLTPYTAYNISLYQYFLGGAYKISTICVWTAEITPGPPQNVETTTVNESCIKLQWMNPKEPIGGLIRSFNITYKKSSDPTSLSIIIIVPMSNLSVHIYDICSLIAKTSYQFTVTAITIGRGTPTGPVQGVTNGKVPETYPGNVMSLNATAPYDPTSTCHVKWDALPEVKTNGNLTSYRVTYAKANSNETVYSEVGMCNTSKIIKELQIYSVYIVKVSATNIYGQGPYSDPVFCHTEGTVPSAPPTNTKAVGSSSTSCRTTWGQVPVESRNGLILGYNITYLKVGDPGTETKFIIVKAPVITTNLTGLLKFTNYSIAVAAFTNKGRGNESSFANVTCETWEDAPDSPPTNLTVLGKTDVNCSFSWSAITPEKANGIIRGYEIVGYDHNNTNPDLSLVGVQLVCGTKATFQNLRPFRIYNFTASGFTSIGTSNKSEILQCMTDESVPLSSPPNLRCQAKTSHSIEVCWDDVPIEQRQGIVRYYRIRYELLNQTTSGPVSNVTNTSSALCWDLTDLEEFSQYAIKVKAVTIKEGNFSETPIKCMTMEGLPRTAPENITGNNVSAYSIWVAWDGLSVQPPGILRKYVVCYRIWNASEDTSQNVSYPATTKKIILDNLQLHTNYCIQVAAFTVGAGLKSNCTYIITDSKVLPPPDGIPSFLITKENSTTVNCSIQWAKTNNSHPDPDGKVVGYVVYYRLANTNETVKEKVVEGVNTTYLVLQELEEFTNYVIRVAAKNIYGAGNKSDVLFCFTKEAAPSLPPLNVTGFNSSSTSILINWAEIPNQDQNGIIRQLCIVVFEVASGNSSAVTLVIQVSGAPARRRRRAISFDPKTKTLIGLKKFTTYAIQVYGVTIAAGPMSPVIYITTAEDLPSAPVTNLTVTNSSSSSLFLTWSNVPEANRHGIIRYFVVFYWKADWPIVVMKNVTLPIDSVRVTPPNSNSTEFKFNMTGLKIWTNYTIQVAGFTVGVGVRTNETTVSTDEDKPCLPPHYVSFDIPKYAALEVLWSEVLRHCRNGIMRGYRLIYQELVPGSTPFIVNFTASQHHYVIENMNMEANYSVRVLAFTRKGDGNATFDLARPDKLGPKSSPINVTAYNFTTPNAVTIEWKPIRDPLVLLKLLGYKVAWRVLSEGGEEIEDAPWKRYTVRKDTLTTTIQGLKNFDRYQIEISGFTRGGFGPSGITFGETCRCSKRITTNYRIFSPYNSVQISPDLKKVNMSGMIPKILNDLTVECCQTCKAHGKSYVDFVENGKNMSAFQHNEKDVIDLIDDSNDLSFPVYGWKWQVRYQGIYRYIPLVESPGFAFLLLEPDTESPLKAILKSIFDTWPYLLICVIMALIAGIIVWFMDTAYNEEQFPHSYFKGSGNGWWWAFISMTTLGYGDKVPAANHSKAFAVIWVLIGLVVYGILSGSICSAFTIVIYQSSTRLYGAKVAAIHDTPEYRFGVRRSARVNTEANYSSFEEVLEALLDRKVDGMLMDAFEAGTKRIQFAKSGKKVFIHKVYDFASTFGVVIAGPSTRLYQCSRDWMSANRAEMITHIAKYIEVVEAEEVNELVEITTGLFDAESKVFHSFLKYSLIALGVFLVLGIIWEIYHYTRTKKHNKLQTTTEANARKLILIKELGGFTMTFLEEFRSQIAKLRQKHKDEQLRFCRTKLRNKKGNILSDTLLKDEKYH